MSLYCTFPVDSKSLKQSPNVDFPTTHSHKYAKYLYFVFVSMRYQICSDMFPFTNYMLLAMQQHLCRTCNNATPASGDHC